ncbi:MAG: hypothetical protein NUV51_13170 [Sulfuricaulis sp.]|nr:hypothetical protein [Sulfuricaulis sp.]
MGIATFLVVLLVWTVAGLLAAIAFGKAIHLSSPEYEEILASSDGTIKFSNNSSLYTKSAVPKSRQASSKRTSG